MKRIAIYKNGALENIALWENDQAWWDAMIDLGYTLEDVTNNHAVQMPNPEKSLAVKLDERFQSLSVITRASFYAVKAAVKAALDSGDVAVARLIIENTPVPEDLEAEKTQLLSIFED